MQNYYDNSRTWESIRAERVLLLDFQYKSTNTYTWKDKTTRGGTRIVEPVGEDFDVEGKKNTKVKKKDLIDIYEGVYLVDTPHMLKWELKPNMTRKLKEGEYSGDTDFDLTVYKPNSRDEINLSIADLIKPIAKKIIIYNLKIMQFVMKARPAGAFIDASALSELSLGLGDPTKTTADVLEVYSAFDETGLLVYSSLREDNSLIQGSPVTPYDGGISQGVMHFLELRQAALQEMYDVTGFHPTDGAMPKDAGLGIEKMRANSFNITMKPYADALTYIISETASKVGEQIKDYIVSDAAYAKRMAAKIGNDKVDNIRLVGSSTLAELGIHIEYEPEDEDKMEFNNSLNDALAAGQITIADKFKAQEVLKTSLKGATYFLDKAIRYNQKLASEEAARREESNGEIQAAAGERVEAAKQQTMQIKYDLELRNKLRELQAQAISDDKKYEQEMIGKVLDAELNEHLIEIAAFPDQTVDTVKEKMNGTGSGVSKTNGKPQASKSAGGGSGAPRAAGMPKTNVIPQDNATNNARPTK